MKFLAFVALAALTTLAFACGDDDDDTQLTGTPDNGATATATSTDDNGATTAPTDDETPEPTADETEEPTADNGATTEVTVDIVNFLFDPASVTVPAGDEVVFAVSNADLAPHTFTVYNDAEYTDPQGLDVSVAAGGNGESSSTFSAGEYFVRCDLHPSMTGTLTAE